MTEIAGPVVEPVIQSAITSIKQQLKYVWSYDTYIENLKEELIHLTNAKERIQEDVTRGTYSGEKTYADVNKWLEEVETIIKQAEGVIKKHDDSKKACCRGVIPNPSTRLVIARKADRSKEDIFGKIQQGNDFQSVSHQHVPEGIVTGKYEGPEYWMAPSRERLLKDISKALLDPTVRIVGISGASGVGKSIFLKQLEKQVRENNLNFNFSAVTRAVVSRSPDWEKVQDDLGYRLGLKMEEKNSMDQKASRLWDRLSQEDKVLIILDDIWEKIDLEKLGIPFDNNHPQIKLLLTSRSEQVLKNKMESEHNFHLEPLKSNEAVDLFKQIIGNRVVDESTLIEQLAKECLGLPVLISPLAASLRSLPPSTWTDTLTKLKQSKSLGVEKFIEKSLEFNYHLIESDEAKSLFLLCGRVGSQIISTDHLLIHGMGLGLVKGVHTMEEAREKVKLLLDNLKASCLLEDNGEGYVKLHDLMGDAALSIVSNARDSLVIRDRKTLKACNDDDFRGCKFMSLHLGGKEDLERLNCPALEMLLIGAQGPTNLEIPDAFFKELRELKVLNLSNVLISSSIQFLNKLHTLCADRAGTNDLMIIGKLKTLQVLTLGGYGITRIRKEIGELDNLRLLNLSDCYGLEVIEAGVLGRLIHLEELTLPLHFNNWDAEGISNNASLTELNNMLNLSTLVISVPDAESLAIILPFQQLLRYNLQIGERWYLPDSSISRTLKLEFDSSNSELIWKEWLQTVLKKTQDLRLRDCTGIPETVTKLSKEGFLELKHIYVQNCPSIEYMIHSEQPDHFPILESLSLRGLINLQKICKGDLPLNYLKNLKSIKIEACDELRNLFSFPLVKDVLPMLEKVEVSDCIMLKEIIDYEGKDGDKVAKLELRHLHSLKLVNLQNISSFCSKEFREIVEDDDNSPFEFFDGRKISLPHLESLTLCQLPKLRRISQSLHPVDLGSLKSIELVKCESLSYAIDSSLLQLLGKLETLAIKDCQKMETVFHMEESNVREAIPNHSRQIHLKLSKLPSLKKLWNQNPQNIPFVLEMKKLEVSECERLESLFSSSMAESIRNISHISIASCMAMNEIFLEEENNDREIEFSSLSYLSISGMGNLTVFSRGNHHYKFPHLMQLIISGCPKMRTFVSVKHGKGELSSEDAIRDESFFNQKVVLPRLEKLVLHSLESMISIWDDNNLSNDPFHMLASIEIGNCGRIQSVFDSRLVGRLRNLEEVKIEGCESLEVLFEHRRGKLRNFLVKESALGFPGLRDVFVSNCCKLKNLFPNGIARTLSKLTNIYVSRCQGLVEVVSCDDDEGDMALTEMMGFYNLTSLHLEDLASLVHFCSGHYELLFPFLKKISIIGCKELKAFMKRPSNFFGSEVGVQEIGSRSNTEVDLAPLFDEKVVFPNLEELQIEGLQVKEIWPNKKPTGFLTDLKKLEVKDCGQLSIIFPSLVLHNLSRLESLSVGSCKSVEVVFQLENYSSRRQKILRSKSTTKVMEHLRELTVFSCESIQHIAAMREDDYIGETYHKTVVFPRLSSLNLYELPRLGSFCQKNHQIELPSLVELEIESCPAVDVLVADSNQDCKPLLLVGKKLTESWHIGEQGSHSECSSHHTFCKLKRLVVLRCNGLLTVIPSKMMRTFHNLETLRVDSCESLQSVFEDDDVVPTAFASRDMDLELHTHKKLKGLFVGGCNSLVTVIPYKMMRAFHNLESLIVYFCESLESVFESPRLLRSGTGSESDTLNDVDGVPTAFALRSVTLRDLPRMKHVWDVEDPRWAYLSFEKLYDIRVLHCRSLRHLFPASVARSLGRLHELLVRDCEGMEGIVYWNNEESAYAHHHHHQFTSTPSPSPSPPESTNFSLVIHYSLEWPSLKRMYLFDFPKAKIFTSVQQKISMPSLDTFLTDASTLESQEFLDEIYANPTRLNLWDMENQRSIPWSLLVERFPQLPTLTVYDEGDGHVTYETRSLDIAEDLEISDNCHRSTILAPSSTPFHNLTALRLESCHGFPYLVTSSVVRGLVQIIELSISGCNDLEEIVTYDSDEDGKIRAKDDDNDIMISFPRLKTLKLEYLQSLRSFSSTSFKFNFPSLMHVQMQRLPKMHAFCEGDFITPYKHRITRALNNREVEDFFSI